MSSRRAALLAVLVSVSLLAPAAGIAAATIDGSPEISLYASDNHVRPGSDATLGVTILNYGEIKNGDSVSARSAVTTAHGLTLDVRSGSAPVEVETGTVAVGTVPEGTMPPVEFQLAVDEDAAPGTYRLPVRVEYTHTSSITEVGSRLLETETVEETMYVNVRINPEARFAVVDSSTTAAPGSDGTVNVTMRNVGSERARNASVTFQSKNPGLTFGGSASVETFAGTWEPGETRSFDVEASFATGTEQRPVALDATVAYENEDGNSQASASVSTGVVPTEEQSFALDRADATLRVGEEGDLNVTLTNDGPRPLENAVLVLEPSGGPISATETEYALGDLAANASATANYDLSVSSAAKAGPRQFTFHVRYQDRDSDTRQSDPLYARAAVEPKRDQFDVRPINTSVSAGSSGEFRVEVTNTGDRPVSDVSAKLFTDDPISTSDSEAFVDALGPGESTTLTFGISVAGSARTKTYPVSMDFRYEDESGDTKLSDTYRLPVEVTAAKGGGFPLSTAGAGVGSLGAAALAGYLVVRRN